MVVGWATLTTVPEYVESGIGLAVVPPLRARGERRVVALEIRPSATARTLAVATATPGRSRVVDAFLDLVDEHVVDRERF